MGLRFHKSIQIMKGVKLNLSKSGVGVSVGTKGAHYSMNTSGRKTVTLGIPGTGLSYVKDIGTKKKSTSDAKKKQKELDKQKEKLAAEKAKAAEEKQKLAAAKAEQAAAELEENKLAVDEAENYIELIKSVHRECCEDIDWSRAKDKALAARVLDGDIDAYYEVIAEADPFEDLVEYGSGFEFGTDDPSMMEVEFCVKSDEVVPKTTLSLLKSGKLSEKEMSKSAYYDLTQDYVCSCAVRLAREIFAVLPVGGVTVHAVDKVLNTATGSDEEVTILSVMFEREKFERANFDRIDPSDFVNSFDCNMRFTKTAGFKPVERLGE